MKKYTCLLSLFVLAIGLAVGASAHEDHDHAKGEKKAGPNGGRILTKVEPRAEFWVMPDKRIRITFLNDKDEPIAPSAQTVTVTTGQRTAPVTLTFERKDNALVSIKPLTADKQPAVVQIRTSPDAKTVVERFTLDFAICPECKKPEYACTCNHAH